MEAALKMTTAKQIEVLTGLVAKNLSLINRNSKDPALSNADYRTLALSIDGKKMTAATREKWDVKDFFNSVSRATIVEAVREAMGDDHANNVGKMDKAGAVKFAIANLPKTKWLPKQLRVAGYDGPAKKAKAKPAKKAKK
jgi:ParB family chromosome partitioning protein